MPLGLDDAVEHPFVYEIDTWIWLDELQADLATVPAHEWDAIAALGFDTVWLMGVWERSPRGIEIALANEGLMESFRAALPDFTPADVVGSPYCIRDYVVARQLGGPSALAAARHALAERGIGLILDFVPNHVAPDHPWTTDHPEYFVTGDGADLARDPASFVRIGERIFANGRDPYFPAWPDVVQLNAFDDGLRAAVVDTLVEIAAQCDGVRCDMAMLVTNDVFARTWGDRVGAAPADEYWPTVIRSVRERSRDFAFLAEAYWDLEFALQQQGLDYCYDKRLYDRLVHEGAESVHAHLSADVAYQDGLVRFLENHDEPRAAATFPAERSRAAAVTAFSLTGARLVHEGQLDGRRIHLPVFLGRRPQEEPDHDLRGFYEWLLGALRDPVFRNGTWRLAERSGWDGNDSWPNLLAWGWRDESPRKLVVVNFGDVRAAGHVALAWDDLRGRMWRLADEAGGAVFERNGDDLRDGLYVEVDAWGWQFFDLTPA